MVNFSTVLQRADDETLQVLINRDAVRLLNVIDPTLLRPQNLRNILLNQQNESSLLRDPEIRRKLIDLLKPDEVAELAKFIDADESEPYKALKLISIRKNSFTEEQLFAFFEVDIPKEDESNSKPSITLAEPVYGLFPHQRLAAEKVKKTVFQGDRRRVLLHMPTGSGKTRTTMNLIADYLRTNENSLVVWLAYSEELCEQAASEFEECWHFLGNRELKTHRFWGNHDLDLKELTDGLIVSSLSKLYYTTNKGLYILGQLGSRANLVVFDEAHQSIAPTYRYVLKALLEHSNKSGLIGLSATPGRTWNEIDEDEKLAKFFYNQKVTLEVEGFENPVNYLVDQGYLAKADYNRLLIDTEYDLSNYEAQKMTAGLDIPNSILKKLAFDEKRNLKIISTIKTLASRHKRILLFATNVNHSNLIAKVLQALGMKAYSITSDTNSFDRKNWIENFKEIGDDAIVLCNYGVLTTGFDAPNTSAALIARPTKSLVLYSQMIGRAIRGPKAGGNLEAEIWTIVDQSLPGFGSVSEAFTNWEDVWTNQ